MDPAAYFITFTTYGTRLHGDPRGSFERNREDGETYELEPNPWREQREASKLRGEPFLLDGRCRQVVAESLASVAAFKGWMMHGLNVRTNHVHVVISSTESPERVMNALKSWTTRRLREAGHVGYDQRIWTRHGSTRRLWRERDLSDVMTYVIEGQGWDLGGTRAGMADD
jgi:REP element-mobilizing transposase RayT